MKKRLLIIFLIFGLFFGCVAQDSSPEGVIAQAVVAAKDSGEIKVSQFFEFSKGAEISGAKIASLSGLPVTSIAFDGGTYSELVSVGKSYSNSSNSIIMAGETVTLRAKVLCAKKGSELIENVKAKLGTQVIMVAHIQDQCGQEEIQPCCIVFLST
jgi:hypothetical protein